MRLSERVRHAIIAGVGRVMGTDDWELFLFGSFARGEANRASDIDLAIRGDEPLPRALEAQIVAELDDTVPTLRAFDLVDLAKAPEALRTRILEEGERWH